MESKEEGRECRICSQPYNQGEPNKEDRRPVFMPGPCGRSVCMSCAEKYRAEQVGKLKGNRKKIKCMYCNALFHSERHQFVVNRDLMEQIFRDDSGVGVGVGASVGAAVVGAGVGEGVGTDVGAGVDSERPRNAKVWNSDLKGWLKRRVEKDKRERLFHRKWENALSTLSAENAKEVYVANTGRIIGLESLDREVRTFCTCVIKDDAQGVASILLNEKDLKYLRTIKVPSGGYAILKAAKDLGSNEWHTKSELCVAAKKHNGGESLGGSQSGDPWNRGIQTVEKSHGFMKRGRDGHKATFELTESGIVFLKALDAIPPGAVATLKALAESECERTIEDLLDTSKNYYAGRPLKEFLDLDGNGDGAWNGGMKSLKNHAMVKKGTRANSFQLTESGRAFVKALRPRETSEIDNGQRQRRDEENGLFKFFTHKPRTPSAALCTEQLTSSSATQLSSAAHSASVGHKRQLSTTSAASASSPRGNKKNRGGSA